MPTNWAVCPKCRLAAQTAAIVLRQKSIEAYGKAAIDEWKAIDQEANAAEHKAVHFGETVYSHDNEITFREDYDAGIDDGEFTVRYRGECTACGYGFSYDHAEVLPPLPTMIHALANN